MVYNSMWQFMSSRNGTGNQLFMNSNKDGWVKVQNSKEKYAFILEDSFNEYLNQRLPCSTMKVGERMNNYGYGIATPKNSPLRYGLI